MEKENKREQKVLNTLNSATFLENSAKEVAVEASFTKGLPTFSIVGLASESIKESKERVKSALLSNDFIFPPKRITINLSPSDLKKEGSHFDLPIALLIGLQKKTLTRIEEKKSYFVLGELGLDGRLKDTMMTYPIALSLAKQKGGIEILTSKESAEKIANIPWVRVYGVDTLEEAIAFFTEETERIPEAGREIDATTIMLDREYYYREVFEADFSEVIGQERAKRAALISAAGMHNILFAGSPGSGKSMIIKRLRGILPPVSREELLESSMQEAREGNEPRFHPVRPFRQPHHTATRASIFGGGSSSSKTGEVALANGGILFFDELPHFSKSILEALREPLEDHRLLISRVNSKIEYKAEFLFAAAMNPCPCGNLLSLSKPCRCSELEVQRYKNRLSEPFLDRIDMMVEMDEEGKSTHRCSSKRMFEQVLNAFVMQKKRGQEKLNGKMDDSEIQRHCVLGEDEREVLTQAAARFGLSQRGINKVLKVARTIADLDGSALIGKKHMLEALSFRQRS